MHLEVIPEKNKNIFSKLNNFDDFYLAGGTALALQIGHRISVDFDLFSDKEISKNLLPKVKRVFQDNKIIVSVNNPDELTVFINETKLTFLKYPFSVIFDMTCTPNSVSPKSFIFDEISPILFLTLKTVK